MTAGSVSVQISGAFLRLHPVGGYGDPHVWSCGLMTAPGEPAVAILGPTQSSPPLWALPLLARELDRHGFTHVVWERVGAQRGADRIVRFPIARWLRGAQRGSSPSADPKR